MVGGGHLSLDKELAFVLGRPTMLLRVGHTGVPTTAHVVCQQGICLTWPPNRVRHSLTQLMNSSVPSQDLFFAFQYSCTQTFMGKFLLRPFGFSSEYESC